METFGYIVLSIVILLVMVLIHEFGHYIVAKILGFTVDEFSVGFGPKIFSKVRKNGERFSLRLLPLGGYCAFYGEESESEQGANPVTEDGANPEPRQNADTNADFSDQTNAKTHEPGGEMREDEDLLSYVMRTQPPEDAAQPTAPAKPVRYDKNGRPAKYYNEQKPWKRILVLLGGVFFNFVSAFIFSLIYIGAVGFAVPQITHLYAAPGGELYSQNLRENDIIIAVNGDDINVLRSFDDLAAGYNEGDTVTLTVDRNGEIVDVEVVRQKITVTENGKTTEYVGFGFISQQAFIGNNAASAFKYFIPYTFKLSWAILGSFGQIITGQVPITAVTGPVGSVSMMAQLSAANWRNILILLPLLASNLAIFNLLPFPALDGAHIVFTLIEWIRKKPINRKVEGMIHFVGMIVLLLFVLIIDILSFAL